MYYLWSRDPFLVMLPSNKVWLNLPTGSDHPALPFLCRFYSLTLYFCKFIAYSYTIYTFNEA